MRKARDALAGAPDPVERDFEDVAKVHGDDGNLESFTWFFDQGIVSLDESKRPIEFFETHIIREFGD